MKKATQMWQRETTIELYVLSRGYFAYLETSRIYERTNRLAAITHDLFRLEFLARVFLCCPLVASWV